MVRIKPAGTSDTDLSPSGRRQTHGKSPPDMLDISPPRRGHPDQGDQRAFPTIDHQNALDDLFSRPSSHFSADGSTLDSDLYSSRKAREKSPTMKQRPKTGLVTSKDIKEEIAKTKKEDMLRFEDMDPLLSGRGAEPCVSIGQRMSKEVFLKFRKKEEEKEKLKEIKLEWRKGLAQKRELESRFQELESEKDKPFARNRDDPELERMLKERLRWGDPMAHLVKILYVAEKQGETVLPDLGANEKMKESGFMIPQEIPCHSWIKRGLDVPANRYSIRPGRHWDGVDRSTGYEKELFKRVNEKRATERET
ncbi:hypothetical protein RND71_037390 [Anisodus tanguticus]|uniref:BUD13 homolog n=1 Tax=Anisodus tanguticus TaxID=243964 RepID=A0AAE1R3A8_9SOLA|nr:hypothetical protein RND71_037390 [Anisodus tanguticus]